MPSTAVLYREPRTAAAVATDIHPKSRTSLPDSFLYQASVRTLCANYYSHAVNCGLAAESAVLLGHQITNLINALSYSD